MKKFYAMSALSLLLAAGCASHNHNQGGASSETGTSSDYNTGATHPATTLGTNPSEDETNAVPNSGSETETNLNETTPPPDSGGTSSSPGSSSSGSSGSNITPNNNDQSSPPAAPDNNTAPDQTSPKTQNDNNGAIQTTPDQNSPDQNNEQSSPQDNHDNGPSGNGSTSFRHTVLMIPI